MLINCSLQGPLVLLTLKKNYSELQYNWRSNKCVEHGSITGLAHLCKGLAYELQQSLQIYLSSRQNLRQKKTFELTLLQIVPQQSQQWLPQRDLGKVTTKVSLLTASLSSEQKDYTAISKKIRGYYLRKSFKMHSCNTGSVICNLESISITSYALGTSTWSINTAIIGHLSFTCIRKS